MRARWTLARNPGVTARPAGVDEASGLSTDVRGTPDDDARVCDQNPTAGEPQFSGDPITVYVGDECDRIKAEKLAEKREEEAERAEEQRRKATERGEEQRRIATERAEESQREQRSSPRPTAPEDAWTSADEPAPSQASEPCIVIETGAKLCGEDAEAWRIATIGQQDYSTQSACRKVRYGY